MHYTEWIWMDLSPQILGLCSIMVSCQQASTLFLVLVPFSYRNKLELAGMEALGGDRNNVVTKNTDCQIYLIILFVITTTKL